MPWRKKIRDRADELGLSLSKVARMAEVTPTRMSLWVGPKKQGEPGTGEWVRLSRALQLPLEYLMDDQCSEVPGVRGLNAEQSRFIEQIIATIGFDEARRRLLEAGSRHRGDPVNH